MRHKNLIIFDLDDTLIDTSDVYWRARTRFVEELEIEGLDSEEIIELFEEIDADHIQVFGFSPERYGRSMLTVCSRLAAHGRGISAEKLEKVKACGDMIIEGLPNLIEGAIQLLTWAAAHFELALITRGETTLQYRKLKHSGLEKYFSLIKIVERKNANTFRQVINEANYVPEEAWVIGDSIKTDINPGIEAGATCIHYAYRHDFYHWRQEHGHQAIGPFYAVDKLTDAIGILKTPSYVKTVSTWLG